MKHGFVFSLQLRYSCTGRSAVAFTISCAVVLRCAGNRQGGAVYNGGVEIPTLLLFSLHKNTGG